jgi:hypothetical protein
MFGGVTRPLIEHGNDAYVCALVYIGRRLDETTFEQDDAARVKKGDGRLGFRQSPRATRGASRVRKRSLSSSPYR